MSCTPMRTRWLTPMLAALVALVAFGCGSSGPEVSAGNAPRQADESSAPDAADGGTTQVVRYRNVEFTVPADWPIYDLEADPSTCVRFDVHAVYLGHPGADMRCPASVNGHAASVTRRAARRRDDPRARRRQRHRGERPRGRDRPHRDGRSTSARRVADGRPRGHGDVRGLARRRPGDPAVVPQDHAVKRVIVGVVGSGTAARGVRASRATATAARAAGLRHLRRAARPATMRTWAITSPYTSVGVYIGGANRGARSPISHRSGSTP